MGVDGPMKYVAVVDDQEYSVSLEEDGTLTLNGEPVEVDLQSIDGGFHYSLLAGAASLEVFVERCEDVCYVTVEGQRFEVRVEEGRGRRPDERARAPVEGMGSAEVTSPMPGVVVAVLITEGQSVQTGESLLILEAMKMENEIRAPLNGVVEAVDVTPGQRVSRDDLLVRIGRNH
jgi:biotin carboxyl carrier protein